MDDREPHPSGGGADRAAEILERALSLEGPSRDALLASACAGDESLREELVSMLAAHDAAVGFLEPRTSIAAGGSSATTSARLPTADGPGVVVGRYQLLDRIGEGGFGVVYLAEQLEPVRRQVALKVIKLGMDTRQVIARFEAERQALAMMDHPSIARVFDAGSTEAGRPYFVMELVKGVPINAYCDAERLDTRQRLQLFVQVCQAIQHAHQKGVIHRDIKPSNVLVTMQDGAAVPKVIDFGIAKATNAELTERTIFTEQRQMVGTPAYMSPEQAGVSGLDIDTRSDVYSLGVLLYELLTGTTPFDTRKLLSAGFDEMVRIIREEEPVRPSTRFSTLGDSGTRVAEQRHTDTHRLQTMLRGDLDWIVMKCLEKDRSRRYETASALAADVHRHLNDEPILAGAPSAAYRLRKFVRRYRGAVIAASIVTVTLVVGLAGTSLGLAWALRERARATIEAQNARLAEAEQRRLASAEQVARSEAETSRAEEQHQRQQAEAITEFVTTALASSDPLQGGSQGFLVTEAMDQAIKLIDAGGLKEQPDTEASLRLTIARILDGNARSEPALRLAQRALEINQALHAGDHPEVAMSLNSVGDCLESLGRSAEAILQLEAGLEMYQRLFPYDHRNVARSLDNVGGCLLRSLGRPAEALPRFEMSLAMHQRLFPGDHPDVGRSMNNLALCLQSLGRMEEALPKYEASLAMKQRLLTGDHPDVAVGLNNIGYCLRSLGRSQEALSKYETALAMNQRLFHGDHPDVAASRNNVAHCLQILGRWSEALPQHEAVLAMYQRLFPDDHPDVGRSLNSLAYCLQSLGRLEEALPKYEASLAMKQRLFTGDHPDVAVSLNNIGNCLRSLGRSEEALSRHETALVMIQRLFPGDHPDVAAHLNNTATCLRSMGRWAEALPKHEAALAMHQRLFPGDHPAVANNLNNVAACLQSLNRSAEALPKYEASLEMHRRVLPTDHPYTLYPQIGLARVLVSLGRHNDAEPLLLDAAEQCERSEGSRRLHQQSVLTELFRLYDAWHTAEADKGYDAKAAAYRSKLEGPETKP